MGYINIAIDGPSGAGKSTLSKALSKEFSFIYLDTGALYRTVGLYIQRKGIESKNSEKIKEQLQNINIEIKYIDNVQKIILNGENVDDFIRTPSISIYASDVSAIPEVRDFLLNLQRDIASKNNCIMDGRDIGTVILPKAQLKIFLTASAEARAERRLKELTLKGEKVTFEEVLKDMNYRDENDSNRSHAPLKAADDAKTIDTSDMDFDTVFEYIKSIIREQFKDVL